MDRAVALGPGGGSRRARWSPRTRSFTCMKELLQARVHTVYYRGDSRRTATTSTSSSGRSSVGSSRPDARKARHPRCRSESEQQDTIRAASHRRFANNAGSTRHVGPPGPVGYGPMAPRRLHARGAGSMCQPDRKRRPETAEGGGRGVCRGSPLDRHRGGVLRALYLRDQQGDPPFEGASDGRAVRPDALMRARSHRPRPGSGRRPSDPDEVRT